MKFLFCLTILVIINISAECQVIDSAMMRCFYSFNYQNDSLNPNNKGSETMVLEIGQKTSLFYSEMRRIGDSLEMDDEAKGLLITDPSQYRGDKYHYNNWTLVIARNYPKGKITASEVVFQMYKYTEPIITQNWKISQDTITISGLLCQKATTDFRGRTYEAWFSRSISTPIGPWKFYGLPGLIIKVSDTKKQFVFELSGIQKLNTKRPMFMRQHNNTITSTRMKVWELKKQRADDPLYFFEHSTGHNIKITTPMSTDEKKALQRPYNPLELN